MSQIRKNYVYRLVCQSMSKINIRLYISLLIMGLCPTIYTTFRTYLVGLLPNEYSYSIAGQLTWVNLIYEIMNEAIILPLFFFMGQVIDDKKEFVNRIKTGLLVTLTIYLALSVLLILFLDPLMSIMHVAPEILTETRSYIRIEAVANIFIVLFQYLCVVLVSIGKDKNVYVLTAVKLVLCIFFDRLLVANMPYSLNLGVNGIGYSNIIVNLLLIALCLFLVYRNGYAILSKDNLSFKWMRQFVRIGSISGLESLVRNIAYILMVSRMVNMVSEQGTYWVANNFIWGWLLLPVLQLGELIKQETANSEAAIEENLTGYLAITSFIVVLWAVCAPICKPFMHYVLGFSDVDKLFDLVCSLLFPYCLFAFQNIFDATFYGRGKVEYMLFESVVTNSIYYGLMYVLYINKIWTPTLTSIALMFGMGTVFDSFVSLFAYMHWRSTSSVNPHTN